MKYTGFHDNHLYYMERNTLKHLLFLFSYMKNNYSFIYKFNHNMK